MLHYIMLCYIVLSYIMLFYIGYVSNLIGQKVLNL